MKKMQQIFEISKRDLLFLMCMPLVNCLVYYGGRMLSERRHHESLVLAIDGRIPVIPQMIWVYWGCYLFWIVSFVYLTICDKERRYQLLKAFVLGEVICFFFFVFLPTTMTRATLSGTGLTAWLMHMTYQIDSADNLFPSIHCFVSWLCYTAARSQKGVWKPYRVIALISAVLVCVATVTVKQHVVADVIAGVVLAEGSYVMAGKCRRKEVM